MSEDALSPFAASDLSQVRKALDGIQMSGEQVSRTLTGTFARASAGGRSFEKTLQNVANQLARLTLRGDGMSSFAGGLENAFSSFSTPAMPVQAFAEGGIVARPTFFGSGGGLGLMGERGAEAIMPLSRGPDGRLGLAASPESSRRGSVHVEIRAADPESFRHSQVQIAGALARAVARGRRGL